jgi:hypothetical protein
VTAWVLALVVRLGTRLAGRRSWLGAERAYVSALHRWPYHSDAVTAAREETWRAFVRQGGEIR